MYKRLLRLFWPEVPDQTTFVWCPLCGTELVDDLRTQCHETSEGLINYKCGQCGGEHLWDFDTPAPLLLKIFDRVSSNG